MQRIVDNRGWPPTPGGKHRDGDVACQGLGFAQETFRLSQGPMILNGQQVGGRGVSGMDSRQAPQGKARARGSFVLIKDPPWSGLHAS